MSMRNSTAIRVVLAVIGVIILASLLTPPIRPPKARSSRISTVNSMNIVTLMLTNTNWLLGNVPVSGK
jgi:hypothetical protein